ncbi:MAG: hypothetical protein KGM99_20570, partial [Burkholderiales bacterium]|nr:hypothetical protein [Burkholderiales bacterium]
KKMGQMTMRWVMAGQTAIIVGLVLHLILPGQHENSFRVLSSSEQLAPGNIVVVFKPETSVKDIQRIMSHNDARIVDGPTVTNAYVLRVSNDQLTQSVTDLRTEPMIELVESLGSGGGK